MSTLKVDTLQTTSGDGLYPARAWVNFDGESSTLAVRASGGVSGVVDNGTGLYTVSFTTAFSDANYAIGTASNKDAGQTRMRQIGTDDGSAPTTGSTAIQSQIEDALWDAARVMLSFTR